MRINSDILNIHSNLAHHPMYSRLTHLDAIRTFMKYHVFAVWDFMSLLKSLQREITCVSVPWIESAYDPEAIRLINEIVIGEESDINTDGSAISHFSLYIKAMQEIGADTSLILNFVKSFQMHPLPSVIKEMLVFHLNLAQTGKVHEVASSFFYGREKIIPEMFESIVSVINKSQVACPSLIYYLQRHIELDGEEHGPKALKFLSTIINTDLQMQEAHSVAIESLRVRRLLWDFIEKEIKHH